jgi:hypothetical protein
MKLSAMVLQNIQNTSAVLGMFQNGILSVPNGTVIKLAFILPVKYNTETGIEDVLAEIYSHIEIYNYKVVSPESTVKDDELWISIDIEIQC